MNIENLLTPLDIEFFIKEELQYTVITEISGDIINWCIEQFGLCLLEEVESKNFPDLEYDYTMFLYNETARWDFVFDRIYFRYASDAMRLKLVWV